MQLSPLIHTHAVHLPPPILRDGGLALPVLMDKPEGEFVFGDGSHPTTRLCAGAVDLLCRTRKPHAVLDVGAGTGILARIARARGALIVWATEIDSFALESTRQHAALDKTEIAIQVSDLLPDQLGQRFDLIVANILEGPLHLLAPSLAMALTPKGRLLLSGFTRLQIAPLRVRFEQMGLLHISDSEMNGWVLQEWSA